MAYATAADVRAAFEGTIPTSDDARLANRLDAASRALDRCVPDVADRIASGDLLAADVADIVVEAVLRRWRNPEGYASESAGDYSYSRDRSSAPERRLDPSGWYTDGEIRQLRPSTTGGAPRTIRVTTPGDGRSADALAWP